MLEDPEYILEEEESNISIDRIRHYYHFDTPFLIRCIEEITLFNDGREIQSIVYDIEEFKSNLKIIDNNGDFLEFHSAEAEDFETDSTDQNELLIVIDFPNNRPLFPEEHRTIKFEYIKQVENYCEGMGEQLKIPLDYSDSVYVYLSKVEKYDCNFLFKIEPTDGAPFDIDNLFERDSLRILNTEDYIEISAQHVEDCSLLIYFSHSLPKRLTRWFNIGGWIGVITVISLGIFWAIDSQNWLKFAPASIAACIAFIMIIRGWLFIKDMDKFDQILIKSFKLRYNDVYLAIIILLFIELILGGFLTTFCQSLSADVNLSFSKNYSHGVIITFF
mgnify:CR=1 FL=1